MGEHIIGEAPKKIIKAGESPYANTDYGKFLGRPMPSPGDKDDPFDGVIPSDAKGYRVFQDYYEKQMMQVLGGQGILKMTADCEDRGPHDQPRLLRRPKKEHFGANIVFACDHVIHQDPVNPEGVWFFPLSKDGTVGYWLCRTCWKLKQAFKFDLNNIHIKCSACVLESIQRIHDRHPDRLHNLIDEK